EARALRDIEGAAKRIDPAALGEAERIDREVLLHQIAFQLRQNESRKYWQRARDTYVNEPFRGIDWFTQGMSDEGQGRSGNEDDWRRVAARVGAVGPYLARARANLEAGLHAGNTPD